MISANLRRIRDAHNLSQQQIAELAHISRIAYRNIEMGESVPKVTTLQNIANALNMKLQDLLMPVRTLEKVRFRALKKMNGRNQILHVVAVWLDNFNYLENILSQKTEYAFKDVSSELKDCSKSERAKQAAELARDRIGLTRNEPIRDIAGMLEGHGVKLFPIRMASDAFFGLCVAEQEGGPAVVVNVWDRISVERWIFSAAHELGHLLLHVDSFHVEESNENQEEEVEANLFASYFLMPGHSFRTEWDETYGLAFVDRVLKVKRMFQVSYKTVLYRLLDEYGDSIWRKFQIAYRNRTGKTLNFVEEPEALSPSDFHQSMPEVLRSQEPDSLSASDFVEDRLSKLVRLAIEHEEITLSRGAEILHLDIESMRERVSSWE